jgi:hypothetical protein
MSRQNSAALRSTKSTTPIRAVQAPTTTPRPPATGVSDFMTGTPQQQAAAGLFGSAAQQRAQAGSLGAAMGFTQPTAPAKLWWPRPSTFKRRSWGNSRSDVPRK